MKSNKIYSFISCYSVALVMLLSMASCDNNFDFATDASYARSFRPALFEAKSIKATSADLAWTKILNADHYIIQLSQDSLLFTTIIQEFTVESTKELLSLEDLFSETRYSARIMTVGAPGTNDSKYYEITFKTLGEQIFTDHTKSFDYTANKNVLEVKWTPGSKVTHLLLTPPTGDPVKIELSAAEKTAGMKLVDAASNAIGSAMAYTIGIYNTDANRRGKISFTSYQELPAGYQLVAPGADLTTLMTGTNVVLILAPGETYTLPSKYAFPETAETIEIRGAYGTMPTLNTIGNLSMSVAAKSIKFSNLKLVGGGIGGDYIFNENTSTTRGLKDFILDGCDISNYRGLNRVRGASYALNNFTINNCVIHDIGTYNIYQGEGASVANITITNTTFNHLEDRFLYFKTPGLVSIKIANCTFYNAIKSTRYLADFNADPANAPTGSFEVSDCIFSKFFGGPWDGTATVKFTNPSGTIANVVRSYVTTDFVTAEPYGTADTYNGTADALFTDPATGNFLIKDKNFPGAKSAGDPRWYMK